MNTAHERTDDMIDYLDAHPHIKRRDSHRALPLPAERQWVAPRRTFIAQGCDQQGRQVPTIPSAEPFPVVPDRLREDYDQSESADAEVFAWLLKGLAVVLLAMLSVWCIASYLELAHV